MAKTIMITGAGSGFGYGTAIGLAKTGHRVIAGVEVWPQATALMRDAEKEGVDLEVGRSIFSTRTITKLPSPTTLTYW